MAIKGFLFPCLSLVYHAFKIEVGVTNSGLVWNLWWKVLSTVILELYHEHIKLEKTKISSSEIFIHVTLWQSHLSGTLPWLWRTLLTPGPRMEFWNPQWFQVEPRTLRIIYKRFCVKIFTQQDIHPCLTERQNDGINNLSFLLIIIRENFMKIGYRGRVPGKLMCPKSGKSFTEPLLNLK